VALPWQERGSCSQAIRLLQEIAFSKPNVVGVLHRSCDRIFVMVRCASALCNTRIGVCSRHRSSIRTRQWSLGPHSSGLLSARTERRGFNSLDAKTKSSCRHA
jgi:hypothetical protein